MGSRNGIVQLPQWFEAENTDFRYSLACVGGFAPVYVTEEISNGQFKLAGGRPGTKVSWQVTAIRQDTYAKAHPPTSQGTLTCLRRPVLISGATSGQSMRSDATAVGKYSSMQTSANLSLSDIGPTEM